jgi:hypothetical protein
MRKAVRIEMMIGLSGVAILIQVSPLKAGEVFVDILAPYQQRIDSVTFGAGNAKSFNSAVHTIDPWPRSAANHHLTANGERMVGAIGRYRDVLRIPSTPQPLAPTKIESSGLSGQTSGTPAVSAPPSQ